MKEQPNLSYVHQLSGGDKDFENKLMAVVIRELPEEMAIYMSSVQTKNYKEAASNVHKLKHKISILGLEKSYHFAEVYEDELREGINNRQAEFIEILEGMLTFIKS